MRLLELNRQEMMSRKASASDKSIQSVNVTDSEYLHPS